MCFFHFRRSLSVLFLCVMALAAMSATAQSLGTGTAVPAVPLKDQHGNAWQIAADTRLVIFASGRKASNIALEVLGQQPKDFLAARHAVYLADMSRMPRLVTRSFALPALREQPFAVGVSLEDHALDGWPRQEDMLTLLRLESGRITAIEYVGTNAQLRSALGL